ncbi:MULTISPECIES: ParB/RepB/Spo0J family partition protein [Robiginitalea]|uniref:Putative ParB-like chromosome partitioning protein n=1 Tax=Robiginitalea biformata (strain ATCC BAA-864 / DSM 15991 / KCTC 12146 / HTCC2501) TaxID=313596 RepID=A4CPZ8_ROBBH|nr:MULTISPECIES: ParB/RepB/Spo0J family partition protein [Robiginitalea]EAR14083.1 putative ParB-like chromosome partitioning protein [Robiginitalea biformata HTCC2501]MDC6354828.1 ParB/RepB/Spo0J family partition protein [Robiginitalea sp. PM2]MDC6375094.1 ParB/RepB/Spo0J family partition protein [Robiginitalea sp. SP8]
MAKATKKQALGRGLSALLKDPENDIQSVSDKHADKVVGSIVELDIRSIEVNPFQPRSNFNDEALDELASSIKELGVIQPITVRKLGFDKYQLVSGERRYRASQRIGLESIPAYIRIANDQETLEMALVENIQRQDLDPVEIALSYQRLIDEIGLTQEKLSDRVGKKRSTVTNYLRLLKLDPIVQTGMRDGFISMGHGRCLVNVDDRGEQLRIYEKILADNLSVRQTEALVRSLGNKPASKTAARKELPEFASDGLSVLKSYLDAPVSVQASGKGKGKITIPFHSKEEFRRLKKRITGD